jgi:hypothetical protein
MNSSEWLTWFSRLSYDITSALAAWLAQKRLCCACCHVVHRGMHMRQ